MSSPSTIAGQSASFLEQIASQAPAHILKAFSDERSSLQAAGVPAGVARAGTLLPDATVLDVNGATTTLAAVRGNKPAVVLFYRGAWCPFCNIAFTAYQSQLVPALAALNVPLIAISPQKPDGSLSMQQKHSLTFTLLSDPANALAAKLGIISAERSEAARSGSLDLGHDIAGANVDGTDTLPMPTAIVVKADGTIAWIDVQPNYATRTEVSDILNAVRNAGLTN